MRGSLLQLQLLLGCNPVKCAPKCPAAFLVSALAGTNSDLPSSISNCTGYAHNTFEQEQAPERAARVQKCDSV